QGAPMLKLGVVLPGGSKRARKSHSDFATIDPQKTNDADLSALKRSGKFLRIDASAPFSDEAKKSAALLIENAHRHGLKILAAVSLKELKPAVPAFSQFGKAWMHQAAPSLDMIHSWNGANDRGALMCLKSGWFDFLKTHIDAVLALPFDGLYLESAAAHPCCHA